MVLNSDKIHEICDYIKSPYIQNELTEICNHKIIEIDDRIISQLPLFTVHNIECSFLPGEPPFKTEK